MKLLAGALLTVSIGWAVVLAAPKPARRPRLAKPARIETAEQIWQGPGADLQSGGAPGRAARSDRRRLRVQVI